MEEIWKDIIGYEGIYQVSTFGRVKALPRTVVYCTGKIINKKERILKPFYSGDYLSVSLYNNKKESKTRYIHQLVLETFVGARPEGMDVCHNDGNIQNNHLDNLRYDSRAENLRDVARMKHQWKQKLSTEDVLEIRKLLDKKELTQVQIAKMYNVSDGTIYAINNNHAWTWLTV